MPSKNTRSSCTSLLIGKKATCDHSVIIGRNEDAKTAWPKHLAFFPTRDHGPRQFNSKANQFQLALPAETAAYSATPEWTDRYGIFAEDGINAFHVAMSATESAYANDAVLSADPFETKTGILEEAMVTVVLPYIHTAKEGVERLGQIVQDHGSAEANGILFADINDAWYMEIGSGHHFVAMRIPDDCYAVVANQLSIETIDFNHHDQFITSPGLKQFVADHHLWPKDKPFNWRRIFGTHDDSDLTYNTPRVWSGQRLLSPSIEQVPQDFELPFLQKPDWPLDIQDAQRVLSDHFQGTPYDPALIKNKDRAIFRPISVATTQESHLLQLQDSQMTHWLAMGIAAQSVYIPFYPQGTKVPTGFQRGQKTYTATSAYWVFKQAGVLVDRNWRQYGSWLSQVQDETARDLRRLRHDYDEKISRETVSTQQTRLIDEANQKLASLAVTRFKNLIARLITAQTQDSTLRFQTDPNL